MWPGALLYGLYNYVAYLFGAPHTAVYPLYLFIVTLSLYTLIALVAARTGTGPDRVPTPSWLRPGSSAT